MKNESINIKKNDDEIDLRQLFQNVRRKWHYFIISLILFGAAAFSYIRFTLPIYEASSSVLIKDSKNSSNKIEDFIAGDVFGNQKNIATEMGILQSRSILEETINELNLEVSYYSPGTFFKQPLYKNNPFSVNTVFVDKGVYGEYFELTIIDTGSYLLETEIDNSSLADFTYSKVHRFGETIRTPKFSFTIEKTEPDFSNASEKNYYFKVNSINSLINYYKDEKLKVNPLNKDATIVTLSVQDNIKERAMDFLNKIGEVYINRDVRDKAAVAGLTLKFVDEQLADISKTLGGIEQDLQNFKEEKGTVNLSQESQAYLEKLTTIDADRIKSEMDLSSLDYLYDYVTKNKDLTQLAPSSLGTPDPLLVNLIADLQRLQTKRKTLRFGTSDANPAVKEIDEQIAATKNSLIENIQSIRNGVKVGLLGISKELAQSEAQIKKVPRIERELLGIQRNFSVNENIYLYLLQKKAETGIAKATAVSDNKVLDLASVNEKPVIPNNKAVAIVALLLVVLVPLFIILLQGFIQNTISSRDDIERLTKIPIIGIVGHMTTGNRMAVANKPKSSIAEAFRSIRANLMYFGLSEAKKVVLITSNVGGEGKSFSTLNLASVLALQHYKVIIVGMDLRKPQLVADLGVKNDKGVSNYLIGAVSLTEVIQKTPVENLDIISSGPVPPNPAELLAKKETVELLNKLKGMYDFVIIDTPPVGIVSDAMMMMNLADINMFILRENYSRKDYVKTINNLHAQGKVENLCILLNDTGAHRSHGYGYGYGYGYGGYGYYDEDQKKKSWFSRLRKSKT